MKIQSLLMRTSLLFLFAFLTFPGVRLAAQTQPASPAQSTSQAAPAVPSRITQAIDETQLVTLKGSVHPAARPEFDQGPVSDTQPMKRMLLMLQRSPEQQTALSQLMAEQMSKDSANFHKWLTPQQFGQQFGPSDNDIQTITDWLTRQGFQGFKIANGKTVIEFSGNVAQVKNTFHTEIHKFVVNGKEYSANVSNPQIPAALAPVIKGIVSLHNFPNKSMRHEGGLQTISRNSHGVPQFTTSNGCGTNGTQPCYFVGPADFAKIYNIPANLDGTGVVIGIVGDSNIDPNDVVDFRTIFGISPTTGPNIIVDGPDPGIGGPNSDEGEADLDVQVSGMVAPKATIDFVVAEPTFTTQGTDLAAFHIIDENLTDVVSESFGNCEAALIQDGFISASPSFNFYSLVWEEAAAQGITVMVSAGDNGSAACDFFDTESVATGGLAVNGIASTPFNVAVGGTDFDDVGTQTNFWNAAQPNNAIAESAKGYIPERTWNISCAATATSSNLNTVCASASNIVAASGGPSAVVAKPSFQTALTPADGSRDLPDLSLFSSIGSGSNSFYAVCEADATDGAPSCSGNNFEIGEVGGTSASSPAFAGIMALINQKLGGRQGNANFVLYKIAATAGQSCNSSTQPLTGSTCAFYDVTKGNDSVPCAGNSLNCSSKVTTTNGVLVDPNHTTTPAWTTAAGYDYATGLGSVNVTNLATAWVSAVGAFKGSTASLTLNGGTSTVNIKHGVSVTATATVNSTTTGTPSGDVSLLGPAGMINTGINDATLSGGSPNTANLTTTFLPGGSYNVTAHYTGDGTFEPSDSNAVPVVVSKENSRLQYEILLIDPNTGNLTTVGATSFTYGASFSDLRIDILNSGTGNCQIFTQNGDLTGCAPDATGSVSITDNGSPLTGSPFNINSAGNAEDQTLQLTGGMHTLSATYSGDLSYNPITTGVTSPVIAVAKAATSTSVAPNLTTVPAGSPIILTATIATQSVSTQGPTGTVTFFNGGTAIGSPVAVTSSGVTASTFAGGTAALTTSFSTTGMKSITATYNADTNYSGSGPSTAVSVTVTAASNTPTITTLMPTSATAGGAAFTLTVNGTNFVSGSTVNFGASTPTTTFVNATQVTAAITAPEIATAANVGVTVTNPSGGGTSGSVNFAVNNLVPTVALINPTSGTAGGAAFTLMVTGTNFVSTSAVNFNGTAKTTTFVSATQVTASILAADIATAGTKPVTVTNPAPGGGTSTPAVNFTVNDPVPTVTTLTPPSATAGGAAFSLTVNGTNFVSNSVVNFNGTAKTTTFVSATQVTASILATDIATVGPIPVTVANPAPGGGTSTPAVMFTVNPKPSFTISASAFSPTPVTAGSSATSTITVTPSNGFTGTVAVTCPTLPPGVMCSPNPLNINVTTASAVMGTLTVSVTGPSPTMMASVVPANRVLSAGNVAPNSGGKGWWTLSGGTGLAALVLLILPGRKRYRAALGLGLVCVLGLTLGCGGGSSGGGATPPTTTTTQLTVSATKVAANGMITVSATVTGGTPTGTVQFVVDGTAVGTAAPLTNGSTGNITVTAANAPAFLPIVGTHSVVAMYSGSSTTTASHSGTLNVTVTGTTQLAISANPASSNANPTVSLTIN